MDKRNQRLRETFLFYSSDLLANRRGQLSARQQARQRAAGASVRLASAIFILVMLGTLGIIGYGLMKSTAVSGPADTLPTLLLAAGVIGMVILVGVITSARYTTSTRGKQIGVAVGLAQAGKARPDQANFPLKIGKTSLRLTTEEHLAAFQAGVEYRVYYLPGVVPVILSAEVVGSEAEAEALAQSEAAFSPGQDPGLQLHRRARPILYVLGLLVLGIPLVGFAVSDWPAVSRWAAMAVLFVIGLAFVFWSLRRVGS
jgi:hypothetical protein